MARILAGLLPALALVPLLLAHSAAGQVVSVIEYRSPESFTRYWSFEPFKPLPPAGVDPVVIPIATNMSFGQTGFTPQSVVVSIPPGSYSMAILNVSMRVTDRQFDRIFWILANGVPIYWGSTVQRLNSTAEADVTLFLNLFRGSVNFSIVLANFLAPRIGITGVFLVNVTLYLYPGPTPSWIPSDYMKLFSDADGNSLAEFTPSSTTINTTSLELPSDTYRAAVLLFTKAGRLDEFFYTNIPAVRDILLYYNERLAGVFHPFPTIFTGGVFPLYWRPLASVNTHYTKSPQVVELTPLLALGKSARISLRVVGMDEASKIAGSPHFSIIAGGSLLVWRDPGKAVTGGSLVRSEASYSRDVKIYESPSKDLTTYWERSSYSIYYEAQLTTPSGSFRAVAGSKGGSIAGVLQTPSKLVASLLQSFEHIGNAEGAVSFSTSSSSSYFVRLESLQTFTPTTDPSKIPYNATLAENDYIEVILAKTLATAQGGDSYREAISESVRVGGGFAVNLTVIDPYGGAVITALSNASANNTRSLTALILYSGRGFVEEAYISTGADLQRPFGYYSSFLIRYTRIL